MTAKTTTRIKSQAPRPKKDAPEVRASLMIADDIRSEQGGKLLAVGVYTDRVVSVTMDVGTQEPTAEKPILIASFAFVVTLSGLTGVHRVTIDYVDPTMPSAIFPQTVRTVDVPSNGQSINFIGKFAPFVTGGFGMKRVVVRVADADYELGFEVRRGDPDSPQARFLEPPSLPKRALTRARRTPAKKSPKAS